MRTTIDSAGRLVIPKALREELGFAPGIELDLAARDGHLEVQVPPVDIELRESDGVLVAHTDREMPKLTAEQVRATLERVRR